MIAFLARVLLLGAPKGDQWSWRFIISPVPVLIAMIVLYNAATIDLFFRPIVTNFVVDLGKSRQSGGFMFLQGSLSVSRKEGESRCEFASVTVRDQDGNKLAFWFQDAMNGETSDRPEGQNQPWGPWKAMLGIAPGKSVKYTSGAAYHECRQVWAFDTPNAQWVDPVTLDPTTWAPSRVFMERRVSYWIAKTTLWSRLPVADIAESGT